MIHFSTLAWSIDWQKSLLERDRRSLHLLRRQTSGLVTWRPQASLPGDHTAPTVVGRTRDPSRCSAVRSPAFADGGFRSPMKGKRPSPNTNQPGPHFF